MSRVANDLMNLVPDTGTFSFFKKNWENVYVFVWALCITVILLNFFNVSHLPYPYQIPSSTCWLNFAERSRFEQLNGFFRSLSFETPCS